MRQPKVVVLCLLAFGAVVTIATAADAQKFDPTPYLRADIPPLTSVVQFSPVDYSAPFTASFDFQQLANGKTHNLRLAISGMRQVTFVDQTIVQTTDVTSVSAGTSGGEVTFTDNPLFTYKFVGNMDGKVLSHEVTLGPKWKSLSQSDNAQLTNMVESFFTSDAVAQKEIASSYGFLSKPLASNGDLGSLASIGSTDGLRETCGVDLSRLRLVVRGVINGAIVGHFAVKRETNDGCIFNMDVVKVVDAKTGQVLYADMNLGTASRSRSGTEAVTIDERSIIGRPVSTKTTAQASTDSQLEACQSAPRNTPPAQYPPASARHREEGVAIIAVKIDSNGDVDDAQILKSSGHPMLDAAALAAAQQWTFDPKSCSGLTFSLPQTFALKHG